MLPRRRKAEEIPVLQIRLNNVVPGKILSPDIGRSFSALCLLFFKIFGAIKQRGNFPDEGGESQNKMERGNSAQQGEIDFMTMEDILAQSRGRAA